MKNEQQVRAVSSDHVATPAKGATAAAEAAAAAEYACKEDMHEKYASQEAVLEDASNPEDEIEALSKTLKMHQ